MPCAFPQLSGHNPHTRNFTYDALSRLTSSNNPESNGGAPATTYGYNSDSLLISKIGPLENQTDTSKTVIATYSYDELHRMTQRSFNDSTTPTNTYCYDVDPDGGSTTLTKGRMTKETNPRGWVKDTAYDPMGRVTAQSRLIDVGTWNSSFQYWYDGNLKQVTAPDGTVVSYCTGSSPCGGTVTPDVEGRPVYANFPGGSINRTYSLGPASSLGMTITDTYPGAGSLQRVKTTNNRFQPASIVVTNGATTLVNRTLAYTSACQAANNGNIAVQNYNEAGNSNNYCYDDLNRITSSAGRIAETFSYDAYGNRTDAVVPAADANSRLNSSGFVTDAAGNLITTPTNSTYHSTAHSFTYFATGELKGVTDIGYTYTYDAHDRRFETGMVTVERTFWYAGDSDRVITEYVNGSTFTDYAFLGSERIASIVAGVPNYYFTDHLGSTVQMADQNGNALWGTARAYTAFGMDDPSYVAPTERRRFTGKERDSESGFDYFESRYYTANLGRFTVPDEASGDDLTDADTGTVVVATPGALPYADISDPQSLNKYLYTRDNPLRYTDRNGHDCPVCDEAIEEAVKPALEAAEEAAEVALDKAGGAVVAGAEAAGASVIGVIFVVLHPTQLGSPHEFPTGPGPDYTEKEKQPQAAPSPQMAEHRKGARPSTTGKHAEGKARKLRDRGGEKGDVRREKKGMYPRRRPKNRPKKGPWPPKLKPPKPPEVPVKER